MEAVAAAKRGAFDEVDRLMAEGEESFLTSHDQHASLLQQAASEEGLSVTLMHVHAEDQLMCAEEFKIIAQEFIDLYRRVSVVRTQE